MGLYKRHPILCTAWAFLEVVLFGGVIFGWGSLVFILKEEGFYLDMCTNEQKTAQYTGIVAGIGTNASQSYEVVNSEDNETSIVDGSGHGTLADDSLLNRGCQAQESKLNLWFTISVSFMYLAFAGIGNAIRLAGLRVIRTIFL